MERLPPNKIQKAVGAIQSHKNYWQLDGYHEAMTDEEVEELARSIGWTDDDEQTFRIAQVVANNLHGEIPKGEDGKI